jgi:predicted P-loop ATPase
MNVAELKLDLFRKIDNIEESELEAIYNKFVALLNSRPPYKLSEKEKVAIDEALEAGRKTYNHDEVIEEARQKYPNLKFK